VNNLPPQHQLSSAQASGAHVSLSFSEAVVENEGEDEADHVEIEELDPVDQESDSEEEDIWEDCTMNVGGARPQFTHPRGPDQANIPPDTTRTSARSIK
jgi:hypothetical protein